MRYLALATDYDETLADHGRVRPEALAALERVKASGRRLILVTGRELGNLREVFPGVELFDAIVAENGGVLQLAGTREERALGEPASAALAERLRLRGVDPLYVGRVIVATRDPHQHTVLEEIERLGLGLQVIFNKGAVMVLPSGLNKGTGLAAAAAALGLSLRNVVAIGDAENDHALLAGAECGVAVANALPSLKERADLVTAGRSGDGLIELCEHLVEDDLAGVSSTRHHIVLGEDADGQPVTLPPSGPSVLFAGSPGSGKSTAAMATLERLIAAGYQCLLLDPEGDYESFPEALVLGGAERPPTVDEVASALGDPARSVAVNLVGVRLPDRPTFFLELLPRLGELRAATGRPHWIFLDEAHHLVPADFAPAPQALPSRLPSLVVVTVVPHEVTPALLERIDTVITIGKDAAATLRDFAATAGHHAPPRGLEAPLEEGEVMMWRIPGELRRFTMARTRTRHKRHLRKYAQGELPRDRSFYFRGEHGELNLRAQNLTTFCQLAEGVDEDTWLFHLREGDYARWFRAIIKDEELAVTAERAIELPPGEGRERVLGAILARYTLPAGTLAPG